MSRILHRSLSVGVVTAMLSIISISTTAAEPFPCSYSAVRDAGWTEAVLKVHEPQLLIEFAERVAGWQVSATPVQLDASGTRSTARRLGLPTISEFQRPRRPAVPKSKW